MLRCDNAIDESAKLIQIEALDLGAAKSRFDHILWFFDVRGVDDKRLPHLLIRVCAAGSSFVFRPSEVERRRRQPQSCRTTHTARYWAVAVNCRLFLGGSGAGG